MADLAPKLVPTHWRYLICKVERSPSPMVEYLVPCCLRQFLIHLKSGILGMHKIQLRPVAIDAERMENRPMMYIALSYDHRIIDGSEAVRFLVTVKELLEDPESLLIEG